jgi:hypothetical protein
MRGLPTVSQILIAAGLTSALFGAIAYAHGFILRPKGFRPLHIIALCCGVLSMIQLVIAVDHPKDGRINLFYGVGLGVFSLVAQSLMAISGRRWRARAADPAKVEEVAS